MNKDRLLKKYQKGLGLYKEGKVSEGLAVLQQLPCVSEIPFFRGLMSMELGHFTNALKEFESFILKAELTRCKPSEQSCSMKRMPSGYKTSDGAQESHIKHALLQLGRLKSNLGDLEGGLTYLHQLLQLPDPPADAFLHWVSLAPLLHYWEGMDEVITKLPTLQFSPAMAGDLDTALLCLHYTAMKPKSIADFHTLWSKFANVTPLKSYLLSSEKPYKVGYLSPDFRSHSVGYFLKELLQHHHSHFEITLYSLQKYEDPLALWFQNNTHVVDLSTHTVQEAAQRIHQDKLHLLVECAGHTAGNGLDICRFKPAQTIITAWGYPNTTGLREVDYRLSDSYVDTIESEKLYSEKLIRMPKLPFLPMPSFTKPALPNISALKKQWGIAEDAIIIGSFNALAKLNPRVLSVWNTLLQQNPKAHLIMSSTNLNLVNVQKRVLALLTQNIDPSRVTLLPRENDTALHRQRILACAFCLDPFPYNGTTTTCEILSMGIPVLTLEGPSHVQRTSATIMRSLKATDFITTTEEAYLHKAKDCILHGTQHAQEQLCQAIAQIDNSRWVRELEQLYTQILL